jgi:subtilisin family serine protease/subtilisin-like proprotein convertase family protein
MPWKALLFLSLVFALLVILVPSPDPGRESTVVISPRLQTAIDGEGPWVVWVFFRDKGLMEGELEAALDAAEADLEPRAARRRAKTFEPGGRLVDEADLAVHPEYLAQACATGAEPRQTSRWLNAASYRATRDQVVSLSRLACVARLDLVNRSYRAAVPTPVGEPVPVLPRSGKDAAVGSVDYGGNTDAMLQVNVPPLHDAGLSGAGVLIGMLDTGFRTTHEALADIPVLGTWDFINNDANVDTEGADPPTSHRHGTQTLSTVAGNMSGRLVGPAFGAEVVLAKTEDVSQEVPIEEDFWVAGLEWIESFGADLASSSLSYYEWYVYEDLDGNTAVTTIAADLAAGRGLLVVNSAGNSRGSSHSYVGAPADGDSVLTVGAVYLDGTVTSFSSPGPTVDGRVKPEVTALGFANTVVDPNDDQLYMTASGTSFSCPLIAGVVALMLERVPQLTPPQIIEALQQTGSQSSNPDNDLGWGIIDAWAAATWFGPVIDHQPLPDTEDLAGPYPVAAVITDRVGVDPADLWLNYRVNDGGWSTLALTATGSPDTYGADIPGQAAHSLVEYYLTASGTNGFSTALPYQGPEASFSFTAGPWRRIDYYASPAETIPDDDGKGVSSTIDVPVEESGFILEVTVDINVTHPDRGELEVLLTGPDGTAVTLHDHSGAGTGNLIGNWPAMLNVDGPGSLDDYRQRSNKGGWTLRVIDDIPGNSGTLNSWGLHFTLVRYVTPVVEGTIPRATTLGPNVPNPFNPRTEISFDLARSGQTRLSIFDMRGMLVRRLLEGHLPTGLHKVVWDGKNGSGQAVSSGTYFYRLETGSQILSRKMLLVR